MGKTRIRANRVQYLGKNNEKAKALYSIGVRPAASYGAEGIGYSPSMIGQLRAMAADCMGSAKVGRCPIAAIAIANGPEWDPYVSGPTSQILEWSRLVPQEAPLRLARAWSAVEEHIQSGSQWAKVTGPMSATYTHMSEIGWSVERQQDEGYITGIVNQP